MLALSFLVSGARAEDTASPGLLVRLTTGAEAYVGASPALRLSRVLAQLNAPFHAPVPLSAQWQLIRPATPLNGEQLQQRVARLRADGRIRQVGIDAREQRQQVLANDARFAQQWWLQAAEAGNTGAADVATAWSVSTGAPTAGDAPSSPCSIRASPRTPS